MRVTPAEARALGHRGFKRFWAGQGLAQLGFQFGGLATAVIAVDLLHATDAQMGYLNAANTAAFLLVGLIAGAWVDRWRKRRVMIVADLARVLLMLAVPLLWFADALTFWHLMVIGTLLGLATVFFDVAYQSYIPVLVGREAIADANGKLESTSQIARLGGPAVAGLLLKLVSAPVLLLINAIGFAVSAVTLLAIRDDEQPADRANRRPLVTEIREGLSFVLREPFLQRLLANTCTTNFGATIVFTLQSILVLRILGLDPSLLGVIMSIGAVGGLVASLTQVRLTRRFGEGPVILMSTTTAAIGIFLVPLSATFPRAAVALLIAASFIQSFAVIVFNITQVSARQRLCPPHLLGRMNASIRFVVWGIMPISALVAGALGTAIGTVPAIWVGVALMFIGIAPFLGRYGRMRTLPTSPEGRLAA